ncbi:MULTISPECIES: hypothetical protein [Pasteurellaceae]|uniref:hypothetical protein n=1 Tax=Pasteurellaceae TaxID=712 RepID=UPI00147B6355|nr:MULTISPECIES: hypothetical protein [Pasteurellaceae]MCT8831476.1 hypothetical protein [Glaesserella parasuis]MCT8838251.1 hypothetical protein [Glaesserella parasuis]MCT8839933.1 hypothetical protein [Glaesserella parasuis]
MMEIADLLKLQIHEAIVQLQQAEKALHKQEMTHASIYVENAKGILVKLGGKIR